MKHRIIEASILAIGFIILGFLLKVIIKVIINTSDCIDTSFPGFKEKLFSLLD